MVKRLSRVVAFGLVLLGALVLGALGAWHAVLAAIAIDWQDGYQALEAAETRLPADPRERERVLLMNAQADGLPPEGMAIDKRLRDAGSLVRVRYESIGADAKVVRVAEIRALVPELPYFGADAAGSDFGRIECPRECREQLGRADAVLLQRGGNPGIAGEWLLRMPLGRAFDLGQRSLTLQDIDAKVPRSLPQSHLRVTLLQACPARVRQGAVSRLEFDQSTTVPLPKGWRARRWVQLEGEGCAAMLREAPIQPRDAAAEARAARALQPPVRLNSDAYRPDLTLEVIRPMRLSAQGHASLVVDDDRQARTGRPMRFHLLRACRYDAAANRWQGLALPSAEGDIALPGERPAGSRRPARIAFRFPEEEGLFWAEWNEIDQAPAAAPRTHSALVFAGLDLDCDDRQLRAAQADEIAVCVPRLQRAEARVVPAPLSHCTR
jgi:hypothetical protein